MQIDSPDNSRPPWRFDVELASRGYLQATAKAANEIRLLLADFEERSGQGQVIPTFNYARDQEETPIFAIWFRPSNPTIAPYTYGYGGGYRKPIERHPLTHVPHAALTSIDHDENGKRWWNDGRVICREIPLGRVNQEALLRICDDLLTVS